MNPAQIALKNYMVILSKVHFGNDWQDGLEYALWAWLEDELVLEGFERYNLFQLHLSAWSWIERDEGTGKLVAVPQEEWKRQYESGDW